MGSYTINNDSDIVVWLTINHEQATNRFRWSVVLRVKQLKSANDLQKNCASNMNSSVKLIFKAIK